MHPLLQLDEQLTVWINQHHHPVLDVILGGVSHLGDGAVAWLTIAVAMLIFGRRRERIVALVFVVGLMATEFLAMPYLREFWPRHRPFVYMEDIRVLGPRRDRLAFPSAHAYLWGQATLLFAVVYPRFKWPLIVLLLLTLYSRPYVGNHHVLDVVGGVVLGLAVGVVELLVAWKAGVFEPMPPGPALAEMDEAETGDQTPAPSD